MKVAKKILIVSLILFYAFSCTEEETVTIAKEYIINPNWDKIDNSVQVERMYLKDGEKINLSKVEPSELLQKLETDTNFAFTANVYYNGVEYSKRKVYFNKDNGFEWRIKPDLDPNRNQTFSTIGKLEKETWYLLAGLSNLKTLYFIFIDSTDRLHQFKVPAVHWTNI